MRTHNVLVATALMAAAFAPAATAQDTGAIEGEPLVPPPPSKVANAVAVFSGLDKITGRITTFDVYMDETVKFGQLEITPRVCFSRPVTEEPKTTSFIEVDEITLERRIRRIFTGWMFAESPAVNAIEHPVNDVWLKACKQTSDVPPPPAS
ncbi:DUF2155 domain-containing protein [Rhizobiaceae bacterium]|nr:DUF2155 domain-containing protein [Rhizobiaceae bacterium]